MKDYINAIEIWPDIGKAANILSRQLDIAVLLRPFDIMKRASTEVVYDDDSPDPLLADEEVGDMRPDQATSASNKRCFIPKTHELNSLFLPTSNRQSAPWR